MSGRNDATSAKHCWLSSLALNLIVKIASPEAARDTTDVSIFYILGLCDEENTFACVARF